MPPTLRGKSEDEASQRERTVSETVIKPQGPRLARDRLFVILSDNRFHSAHELNNLPFLKQGEWVALLRELVDYGHSIGRRSHSFVLRGSRVSEKTDFSELMAGVDTRFPEDMNVSLAQERNKARVLSKYGLETKNDFPEEPAFNTVADYDPVLEGMPASVVEAETEDDRLSLSIDPNACVLSARQSVTATRAILAMKSSGKTYLAGVIAEEFLRFKSLKLPFVVIDPTGAWYGLAAYCNGQPAAHDLIILGGAFGHCKLTPFSGSAVARLVVDLWPQQWILDVSDMMPEDQHQFVADFGTVLFTLNKKAVHLFVDEADEFAPQQTDNTYKHQRRCLNVLDRIVRRGRKKGIGSTLITQRPAVIHKNLLSQVDGLFVLCMTAPHDLEAVEDWLKPLVSSSERSACLTALPHMKMGEAFYMTKTNRKTPLVRFVVKMKETFDSSKTPEVDEPDPVEPVLGAPPSENLKRVLDDIGKADRDD